MGKRLDQLSGLDDGPPARDALGAGRHAAKELCREVLEMLESGDYDFAWGFLKDLSLTLETADRVTPAQLEAVGNIKRGQAHHERQREGWERHERRTGRRYEGWMPSD